jgi:hypothetical protein
VLAFRDGRSSIFSEALAKVLLEFSHKNQAMRQFESAPREFDLTELLNKDVTTAQLKVRVAFAELLSGKTKAAETSLDEASSSATESDRALLSELGLAYFLVGRDKDATKYFVSGFQADNAFETIKTLDGVTILLKSRDKSEEIETLLKKLNWVSRAKIPAGDERAILLRSYIDKSLSTEALKKGYDLIEISNPKSR